MTMSKKAQALFHKMQDFYVEAKLSPEDGCCCAADFFVWVMMAAALKKEDVIFNMNEMFPGMVALVEANWEGLNARREVLMALDKGESGGRLQ